MKSNSSLLYILFTISILIYLLGFVFSYDYLLTDLSSNLNRFGAIRSLLEYGIMYVSLILFCSWIFQNKYLRILSYIILLLITINSFISYCCYLVYGSGFNIGMAVSVLDTNVNEASNMVVDYLLPLFISVIFFIINSILVAKLSIIKLPKKLYFIYFIWIVFPLIFIVKHKYVSNKGGGSMIKNVVYHTKDIAGAYQLSQSMSNIKNNKIIYNYKKINDGIETVILVIGESARKQNMSLYGYDRKTSPNQDALQSNMIIYSKANSPAAITNLSIPMILSKLSPEEYKTNINMISDNVVNLANSLGYDTYWLTTQNNIKGVTEIASYSKNKKWVNGYDSELLPDIKEALNKNTKKFIVIHIIGSHPNPCLRYPDGFGIFNDGNSFDCYDNSILYTDKFLGEIFNQLKNRNAALIYLSDHGLKSSDNKMIHSDSKESTQVPFYAWFSNVELMNKYKFSKNINQPISTSYTYPMIMKLFGLEEVRLDKVENNEFIKLDHKVINYNNLEE